MWAEMELPISPKRLNAEKRKKKKKREQATKLTSGEYDEHILGRAKHHISIPTEQVNFAS